MVKLKVRINKDDVLARLGKRKVSEYLISPAFYSKLNNIINQAYSLIVEDYIVHQIQISFITPPIITFSSGFTIHSNDISKLLENCSSAYLIAATIGNNIGIETARLLENGDSASALILDAIGSVAAESLISLVNKQLLLNKPALTRRFSPGYGDWGIKEQGKIINLLNANSIGITVNEAGLMIPEKSVTAIIGMKNE